MTPPDYLKELEKLQDQIPPFPDAEAMQVRPACTLLASMLTLVLQRQHVVDRVADVQQ